MGGGSRTQRHRTVQPVPRTPASFHRAGTGRTTRLSSPPSLCFSLQLLIPPSPSLNESEMDVRNLLKAAILYGRLNYRSSSTQTRICHIKCFLFFPFIFRLFACVETLGDGSGISLGRGRILFSACGSRSLPSKQCEEKARCSFVPPT